MIDLRRRLAVFLGLLACSQIGFAIVKDTELNLRYWSLIFACCEDRACLKEFGSFAIKLTWPPFPQRFVTFVGSLRYIVS